MSCSLHKNRVKYKEDTVTLFNNYLLMLLIYAYVKLGGSYLKSTPISIQSEMEACQYTKSL